MRLGVSCVECHVLAAISHLHANSANKMFPFGTPAASRDRFVVPRSHLLCTALFLLAFFCHGFSIAEGVAEGTESSRLKEANALSAKARLLLSDRCALCHGPDSASREADLRLDQQGGVFRETENGGLDHVVVPGDAEASELISRITAESSFERMPPPESGLELSATEIDLLRRWVEAGAPWQEHWSFEPIDLRAIPPMIEKQNLLERGIDARESLRTGIDAFVVRRLIEEERTPNHAADRAALLRRVSFDLTGLPATPAEIKAFLSDDSPDAYERRVDRLLASPRFGERMAASWLDAARYADTYGYQADVYREMWPWRDWVVAAFNEGMPYDRFLTWQIAGDLIPEPTRESRLATAFNRNHRQTNEGGSIEEEFHVEYVADRVNTLGTAVLGLTLECAQCHDHKFDPITQREYYQFFAFFNNIDESGLYSHFTDAVPTPTLRLPSAQQTEQLEQASQAVEKAEQRLSQTLGEHPARFRNWVEKQSTSRDEMVRNDRLAYYTFDATENNSVPNEVSEAAAGTLKDGVTSTTQESRQAILLNGDNHFETPIGGDLSRDDAFTIAAWIRADRHYQRAVIWHRSRAWTDAGSRGYELLLEDGRLSAALIHFWPGNAIRVKAKAPLPVESWTHVAVAYDGSSRAAGLSIYVDGTEVQTEVVRDGLTKTINGGGADKFAVGARFRDRGFTGGMFDDLQIFARRLSPLEIETLPSNAAMPKVVDAYLGDSKLPGRRAAVEAFHASAIDPEVREARAQLATARKKRSGIEDGIREIMAMEEMPAPRETFVLKRGAYDAPGERVEPDVPVSLPAMKDEWPPNRLGLARWLTDSQNPLVARVATNRLWQQFFGGGLTATPEDFGHQGEPPTHPELLNWLSGQLINDGWDLKRTIRRIVLSGTYRQSATVSAEVRSQDPDNALLARGPSRRLPVEMIRDAALYSAGLLAEYQGGPPVKPYQPPGLWEEKSGASYQRDSGAGSHRRSLYTIWKRTSPPPAMLIFDAPTREVCVARRRPTQTPLQALVMLNDEQYVEAARGCASRVLDELHAEVITQHNPQGATSPEDDAIIDKLCLHLIGREPTEREQDVLRQVLQEQREIFSQDPSGAEKFLAIGDMSHKPAVAVEETAAVTVLAQTLMNYAPSVRQP